MRGVNGRINLADKKTPNNEPGYEKSTVDVRDWIIDKRHQNEEES